MGKTLRLLLCSCVTSVAMGTWAQAPASGTYRIKSCDGKYVEVLGKYYAKPDASTTNDYTQIGVGIGYNTGDGYRVYSLSGTPKDKANMKDGQSTVEVYDYIDKAYKIVSQFAQKELTKKATEKLGDAANNEPFKTLLADANAMADSICAIYTDDYAYMTIIPQAHYGNKWLVRAKATIPSIPNTITAVGNYIVTGDEVIAGHKCTDVWDWAKQHVLKYIDEHQTNQRLKEMVKKYIDQVKPGTTYYLSCDAADNSFGYETTPSDRGIWTMEAVNITADGLTPGVKNIQNNSTTYYVDVKGKYEAEPDLTMDEIKSDETNKANTAITLNFGRYDRNNDKVYRITELSNQGQDVVAYMAKGMEKAKSIIDKKGDAGLYATLATTANGMFNKKDAKVNVNLTADQIKADVHTAIDLCAEHYAYMKLKDNGDGSVSLYVDVPQIPALLDDAYKIHKGDQNASFLNFVKDQITEYFNNSETAESLKKLWNQNKDKWEAGKRYYLSAEPTYKTFEFTENKDDAATKWTLATVSTATNPLAGYFRIKNVGGYNGQQYVDVRGRVTADVSATATDKATKPGSVLYINLDANASNISSPYKEGATVKAYELLNLRSQGLDIMNGCEATTEELQKDFSSLTSAQTIYQGYVGFGRALLAAGTTMATSIVANLVPEADKPTYNSLMKDFSENYLPSLKFQVYLIPVEGKQNTYLVRSITPSLKPIVDFYKANKTDMDKVVVPVVRTLLSNFSTQLKSKIGFAGEEFTDDDDATINSWYSTDGGEWHVKNLCEKDANRNLKKNADGSYTLTYNTILGDELVMFDWLKLQMVKALKTTGHDATIGGYVRMIHYNTPYYLIEGDNHDANGNRGYTGNANFGFANDGLKAGTPSVSTGGSIVNDLASSGNHAYWTLEAVDGDNYFTVKPNSHAAKNGKYYASTYLDFPFEIKGSNVSAVYTVSSQGVQTGEENGTSYKYVKFSKCDGVIPAATPAIIEFNQSSVDNSLALQPVLSDARATQGDLIQGTFLGGKHNATVPSTGGTGLVDNLINSLVYPVVYGSIEKKWGVTTDGKDLYLFGYNKNDKNNPYGFYLYSKSDEAEDSQYNLIPANKPFLIQTPSASGAKVYVTFDNGTVTGIDELFDNTKAPENGVRYNLAGQHVDESYKGVVIVNGKKYVEK